MSQPTKLSDLLSLPQYDVEFVPDAEAMTIRAIKKPREYGTTAPARAPERSFRCLDCQDRGLIRIKRESTMRCKCCPDGHRYDDNVRCYCKASYKYGPREGKEGRWEVPTFAQVFGRWPAAATRFEPKPTKPPESSYYDPEPEPDPDSNIAQQQPETKPTSAPFVPMVEELDP